jgi:hypothetical protein
LLSATWHNPEAAVVIVAATVSVGVLSWTWSERIRERVQPVMSSSASNGRTTSSPFQISMLLLMAMSVL